MKKKVLSVLLSTAMVASLLVGCGDNGSAPADQPAADAGDEGTEAPADNEGDEAGEEAKEITGEITVLTNRTDLIDTDFADYKAEFEAKYPGTTVNFEGITDYEGDVAIRMQTSDYGDVLMIPNTIKSTQFSSYFEPLGTVEELSEKYDAAFLNDKNILSEVAKVQDYGAVKIGRL